MIMAMICVRKGFLPSSKLRALIEVVTRTVRSLAKRVQLPLLTLNMNPSWKPLCLSPSPSFSFLVVFSRCLFSLKRSLSARGVQELSFSIYYQNQSWLLQRRLTSLQSPLPSHPRQGLKPFMLYQPSWHWLVCTMPMIDSQSHSSDGTTCISIPCKTDWSLHSDCKSCHCWPSWLLSSTYLECGSEILEPRTLCQETNTWFKYLSRLPTTPLSSSCFILETNSSWQLTCLKTNWDYCLSWPSTSSWAELPSSSDTPWTTTTEHMDSSWHSFPHSERLDTTSTSWQLLAWHQDCLHLQ